MRAGVYLGERHVAVHDVSPVEPEPNQVQVAVAYTGLCGTDLHIFHGDMDSRVTLPAVIGHEMSGTVVAVGSAVSDWQAGDTVTVMPLRWCGTCPACRAGHRHICQRLDFVGIDSPGSLQQRWNLEPELLVRLPKDLSLRDAALAEPAAVAVHDVRRADLQLGERALVVGGGPIGMLIALMARAAGAEVLISEPDAFRRRVAEEAGIPTIDPLDADLESAIDTWTGGAGPQVVFEVSGSQPGIEAALSVAAVRGRVIIVGIHAQPRQVNLHRVFWREISLIGARVYERRDFETALELLARGVVPTNQLISQVRPLEEVGDAFAALEQGGSVMKVLLDCQGTEDHER